MSAVTTIDSSSRTMGHGRTRALGVLGAVLATVAVWAIEVQGLGIQLSFRFGGSGVQTVSLWLVVGATAAASLAGWGTLVALERRVSHARQAWTVMALALLVASLGLPLAGGTTPASQVGLALLHLAAAGVLIPALRHA